jgi:prolyl-tRNA synthetase
MTHSDDVGLVLPPRLAPIQAVIVPIYRTDEQRSAVVEAARRVRERLPGELRVRLDDRDTLNPGAKYYEWEAKGVPLRIEIGPKDLEKRQVTLVRRFAARPAERKQAVAEGELGAVLPKLLETMQRELLEAALRRREANSHRGITDYEEFKRIVETVGGFIYTGFCGAAACERKVQDETKATIRLIPDEAFRSAEPPQKCICGGRAEYEVVWARAY